MNMNEIYESFFPIETAFKMIDAYVKNTDFPAKVFLGTPSFNVESMKYCYKEMAEILDDEDWVTWKYKKIKQRFLERTGYDLEKVYLVRLDFFMEIEGKIFKQISYYISNIMYSHVNADAGEIMLKYCCPVATLDIKNYKDKNTTYRGIYLYCNFLNLKKSIYNFIQKEVFNVYIGSENVDDKL